MQSFTPDRHEFHVKFTDLYAFCQAIGNTHSNRITSLLIDARYFLIEELSRYSYDQGLEDAESIAKSTTLLCRDGKLQRIIVNASSLLDYDIYMVVLVQRLAKEVEAVRRDVFVKGDTQPLISSLRRRQLVFDNLHY